MATRLQIFTSRMFSSATNAENAFSLATALRLYTNDQLKKLACNCGLPVSGKKSTLISTIMQGLEDYKTNIEILKSVEKPIKLLSIDLGLKNIAACHYRLDSLHSTPHIVRWKLVSLDGIEEHRSLRQPIFASMAVNLVKSEFLHYNTPSDIILIEQQRLRSSGSKAVNQHIANINILEGMLHAIIQTYVNELKSQILLESVSAKQVMKYWIRDPEESDEVSSQNRYKVTKKAKVSMAENLLLLSASASTDNVPFTLGPDVNPFDPKIKPKVKKDDLSDSLLQGLAWILWQQNLHLLQCVGQSNQLQSAINDIDNRYNTLTKDPTIYS